MTNIIGTLKDSAGNTVDGTLKVNLSTQLIDVSTSPDSLLLPIEEEFAITSGDINVNLPESETYQVPYSFEFIPTGETVAILKFNAIVPNVGTVQFASLTPTGITNVNLDTSAYRVAELLGNDENLSSLVRDSTVLTTQVDGITTTTKYLFPKTFDAGVIIENLSLIVTAGEANWTFTAGYINAAGVDTALTGTDTTETLGGRYYFTKDIQSTQADTFKGFYVELSAGVGATALSGVVSLRYKQTA